MDYVVIIYAQGHYKNSVENIILLKNAIQHSH